MIKYVIAHINSVNAEKGTAQVEVLYKNKETGCYWDKYHPSDELVLIDTREEAEYFIRQCFGNNKLYMSYGVQAHS